MEDALWQYPSRWESCSKMAFRSWETCKQQNHFYSPLSYPSSTNQNTHRKWSLATVKRDIWYQREIKEVCCSQNIEAQTVNVCINNSMLIIPRLAREVLVPEYSEVNKWSDVVLHILSSMTHQGREWSEIKGIISDTSWLKLSTYWWRHKGTFWDWQESTGSRSLLF